MTPTNHHHSDQYLEAYRAEISHDLRAARFADGRTRPIRGALARTMVRLGVSLMPDRPSVVDDRIIILPHPASEADLPEAA